MNLSPGRSALLLGASIFMTRQASADCGLNVQAPALSVSWSENFEVQTATLTVTKRNAGSCSFAVGFGKGAAGTYERRTVSGGTFLSYQLAVDSSGATVLKDPLDGSPLVNALSGSFSTDPNQSQTLTYYFIVPLTLATAPLLKASGLYLDTLPVNVYELEGSGPVQAGSTTLSVSVAMPKIVALSLADEGEVDFSSSSRTMDFGTLHAGAMQSASLTVRTNAGYSLSLTSENGGVMRLTQGNLSSSVKYQLAVDGAPFDLSGGSSNPVEVARVGGQTSMLGRPHSLTVTIGDLKSSMAGEYVDFVTITATTIE